MWIGKHLFENKLMTWRMNGAWQYQLRARNLTLTASMAPAAIIMKALSRSASRSKLAYTSPTFFKNCSFSAGFIELFEAHSRTTAIRLWF